MGRPTLNPDLLRWDDPPITYLGHIFYWQPIEKTWIKEACSLCLFVFIGIHDFIGIEIFRIPEYTEDELRHPAS